MSIPEEKPDGNKSESALRPLLEAVNEAARATRQGWIFYLSVMLYLLITAFSISHKSMLLLTPVTPFAVMVDSLAIFE